MAMYEIYKIYKRKMQLQRYANPGEIRASLIGFPGGSVSEESARNVGDPGSFPG